MTYKGINQIILFNLMGFIYVALELVYDGSSHWSMYLLGGICGILIGLINERVLTYDMPLWKQVLYGECIVLPLEFLTGCILHLWLNIQPPIWDYSNLPFNILGQSSLLFAIIFIPVILSAIFVDDYYRWIIMGEEKPRYKLV